MSDSIIAEQAEEWKSVVGFEGYYEVSNHGRIRRIKPGMGCTVGRILKNGIMNSGYADACLYREQRRYHYPVARAVLTAFVGHSKKHINHKNGKKLDNRLDNLEYVTQSENNMHKHRVLGHAPNHAKLKRADIPEIRNRIANRESYVSIGKSFGVSAATVCNIHKGKVWIDRGTEYLSLDRPAVSAVA